MPRRFAPPASRGLGPWSAARQSPRQSTVHRALVKTMLCLQIRRVLIGLLGFAGSAGVDSVGPGLTRDEVATKLRPTGFSKHSNHNLAAEGGQIVV